LRLDESTALNLSRFDIGGKPLMRGIKGFLYGERGVWRPGDSLFFNFILDDKGKTLPIDVPVAFELYNPQGQIHRRLLTVKISMAFIILLLLPMTMHLQEIG